MHAVALVAVDTDRERLKVHQFVPERDQESRGRNHSPKTRVGGEKAADSRASMHRSQSLMNVR